MGREHGWGAVGAHTAGIGAGVAVVGALVVLSSAERQGMPAVTESEKRDLFASQELLDDDGRACFTEATGVHHMIYGAESHCLGGSHHHAFAGGQAIGLDYQRGTAAADEISGGGGIVELLPARRGDAGGVANLLGEGLAALEPGGSGGGAKAGNTSVVHRVDDAGDERRFGTGDY